MKTAVKFIQSKTIDFLIENIGKITDYREANKLLINLCGVDTFFRNQNEFLFFLKILKPGFIVCEDLNRREYGDFQTPFELADSICSRLVGEGVSPDIVIEPTFGIGSFLVSALKYFPDLKKVYGVEIHESYFWQAKFAILELFMKNPNLNKPVVYLYLDDVFKFDFREIEKSIENYNVLIIGNPPWVTTSELSVLSSKNLPEKSNFKRVNGFDAITGKGNFDIGESVILMMLNSFSKYSGHIVMLAKNSVIKNLIYDLKKTNYNINNMTALAIDAKKSFNASVEASVFKCNFKPNNFSLTCKVSSLVSPDSIQNEFGWVGSKFVSSVTLYKTNMKYDGTSPYVWRQGVKHDCSGIMELDFINNRYVNGPGKEVNLEKDAVYGLVKSSDLNSLVLTKPRKYVIITQKKIGEDTAYLSGKFPKLYKYLTENYSLFEQRKSCIYKNKPPFSIFGIGDYSFKPYKVAISGLYKRSKFSLVLPENNKPVMLDDTCYFTGFDNLTEVIFVWAVLNSEPVQKLLASIVFLDAKRPYTKDVLMRISIDKAAQDMTYNQITALIESLDKKMLANVTEDKWDTFLEKLKTKDVKKKQLLLPEITTNPPLPQLALAGKSA